MHAHGAPHEIPAPKALRLADRDFQVIDIPPSARSRPHLPDEVRFNLTLFRRWTIYKTLG